MGDTQNLGKLFGTMGTDWFSNDDPSSIQSQPPQQQHPLQQPQPRSMSGNRSQHRQLRPKSVMELGGSVLDPTFSNTWLNQRHPSISSSVIERPRSADISSWALPTSSSGAGGNTSTASWKPLHNQHDIDINLWKDPMDTANVNTRRSSSAANTTLNLRKTNFAASHYLNTPSSSTAMGGGKSATSRSSSLESVVANDFGYGSDQSDASTSSRRFRQSHQQQPTQMSTYSTTIMENKDDHVDMDLIRGSWHR